MTQSSRSNVRRGCGSLHQISIRLYQRTHFELRVPDSGSCLIWDGCLLRSGYGQMRNEEGDRELTHRVAYRIVSGSVPTGLEIDHLCRQRDCLNVAHLEPVLPRENKLRGVSFAAKNKAKTHCDHGHEFTADNTAIDSDGHRRCRTCNRRRRAEYLRRKAEQRDTYQM